MRVAIGRKGDYAIRAVLDVARHHGSRRKAREIAETMDIPRGYVNQILSGLVAAGICEATAGPDGGYVLARPPQAITLLEVVEAAEGPVRLERCVLEGGPCDWEHACPLHDVWWAAQQALVSELARVDFHDLAQIDTGIEAGRHVPVRPVPPGHERPRSGVRTPPGSQPPPPRPPGRAGGGRRPPPTESTPAERTGPSGTGVPGEGPDGTGP